MRPPRKAAGNIAADHVGKSAPDGYTILIANNTIVIQAAMPQTLAFVKLPDVSQRLTDQLFDVRTGTPEQFGALIKSDIAKWTKVVRDGNIKPE